MSAQIRPLCYALGAEITGIDIRKSLDDQSVNEIRNAFLKYEVLLFRGQPLTEAQQVAFTRHLGTVSLNEGILRNRVAGYPEILRARPKPDPKSTITDKEFAGGMKKYAGNDWHSDRSFKLIPSAASLLRAVEIPSVGGDTMFACMYHAYETLSDGMKKLIEPLYGIHPGSENQLDHSSPERLAETRKLTVFPVAQPLVRVHPETGRKSLFLTERIEQIVGMTVEESRPLMQFLLKHGTRPQFCYRHVWQKDDLLMWDNRCTLHLAVLDYDKSQIRQMDKTATEGTPCGGYRYEGALQ